MAQFGCQDPQNLEQMGSAPCLDSMCELRGNMEDVGDITLLQLGDDMKAERAERK